MNEWAQRAVIILQEFEWSKIAYLKSGLATAACCPHCRGYVPLKPLYGQTEALIKELNTKRGHKPDCELIWLLENSPAVEVEEIETT